MTTRGQIPDSFIQEVLARVDIVDVVGRHVTLKKGGANFMGLCPFHGEKSPSFSVSPSKQFYYCFGCGATGDAIRFLTEHTGAGFVDAVESLASQVGMQVPRVQLDAAEQARVDAARERQASLSEILERAAEHYRAKLKDEPRAIDYLKRRGLSGAIAREFGLGFAPEGWRSLASAFARYDDPMLAEAGLVIVQGEEGAEQKRYDRFRDRIMFPIRSVKGEVIGFGGRVIDAGEPKYLNSPETPVFVKGRELYGLYEGRTAIRERAHALVVEGYMDVVALAQSGFGNAVATLGTACTPDHVQKLLRFTDNVVFSFDGDAAGRRAAARALEAVLPHVNDLRTFRFLFLPPEHDPDSFVRELGADAFEAAVAAAVPLSQQIVARAAEDTDAGTAEGRSRLIAQARPLWTALPQGAFKVQMLADIAAAGRVSNDELASLWGGSGASASRGPRGSAGTSRPSMPLRPRARVAALQPADHAARMLLTHAALWHELTSSDHELLTGLDGWHSLLFRWLERDINEHGDRPWPALRDELAGQSFEPAARQLVDGAELLVPATIDELRECLLQLRRVIERLPALRHLGRA